MEPKNSPATPVGGGMEMKCRKALKPKSRKIRPKRRPTISSRSGRYRQELLRSRLHRSVCVHLFEYGCQEGLRVHFAAHQLRGAFGGDDVHIGDADEAKHGEQVRSDKVVGS